MPTLAIIGGTGLTTLEGVEINHREVKHTPYGEPSGPLIFARIGEQELIFLPRHGQGHTIPPHKINYRANLWALREAGACDIIAVNAVGAIRADMRPGRLVIPDQIIDYTHGRICTFFEEGLTHVTHIDFTEPYCEDLRQLLIRSASELAINIVAEGTYGATHGPRLETRAEIDRLERDSCDLVGMTGMPEAALARELDLCYACVSVVANMAAGRSDEPLTMEIIQGHLVEGMATVRRLIQHLVVMRQ
jgi:5'-methylthioinosine phosphorylase